MKLSISADFISKRLDGTPVPFEEFASLAKQWGFDELDLKLKHRVLLEDDWQQEIDRRAEIAAREGLVIKTLHLPYDYPRADDGEGWLRFEEATRRFIDAGVQLGVDCAAIHPRTSAKTDYDEDQEHADALAFLHPYCEYAQKAGLPLAIENMRGPGWSAPARLRRYGTDVNHIIRLADELGEGICWDTGHANISMQNQYKSLKKIGSRLRMLHINDNHGENDVHLAPFLGNVDWDGVVRGLKEIGFKGSLNQELNCRPGTGAMMHHYGAYVVSAGERLREMFETCEV